jgi:hypothetical protein
MCGVAVFSMRCSMTFDDVQSTKSSVIGLYEVASAVAACRDLSVMMMD